MKPAALAACLFLLAPPLSAQPLSGTVTRIVDGDTWYMTGSEIRVRGWGFDTPECTQPCDDAASRALARLILGRPLSCEIHHYSHSRPVARCWQGKMDVGQAMIARGHAVEVCRFSHNAYGTCSPEDK